MSDPGSEEDKMEEFAEAMTGAVANAFKNLRLGGVPPIKLSKFWGSIKKPGDLTLVEWLEDLDIYCRQLDLEGEARAAAILDHLKGPAREEILCLSSTERHDPELVIAVLKKHFGPPETLQALSSVFHARTQLEGESLRDFSRALIRLYDRMEKVADCAQKGALLDLKDAFLKEQFAKGARDHTVQLELKRLEIASEGKPFSVMREEALKLLGDKFSGSKSRVREVTISSSIEDYESSLVSDPIGSHPIVKQLVKGQQEIVENQKRLQDQLNRTLGQNSTQNVQCRYCKKYGHYLRDCRKRQYSEAQKQTLQNIQATQGHTKETESPENP